MWRFCEQMNIIKRQRFYNTPYNEHSTIVLYSALYTHNGTIEASLMPFQTRRYQEQRRRWRDADADDTSATCGDGGDLIVTSTYTYRRKAVNPDTDATPRKQL